VAKSKIARKAEKKENDKNSAEPTSDNRRARFEYEILDSLEVGIVLTGTEIKSVRAGGVSLNEAYARVKDDEVWLVNMHVAPYKEGSFSNHEPRRSRKLLLHKAQIADLKSRSAEKGLTLVPLRMYFTRGMVKLQIGLARGKKIWDKRKTIAERENKRELQRATREN